jgi:uncharacterized membrane protein
MSDAPTAEQVRAIHERQGRAQRHVFLAMATVFALLAWVEWKPQYFDTGLWIIATPLILAFGGMVVWAVGTFLALPLEAYYKRRDKKYEGASGDE